MICHATTRLLDVAYYAQGNKDKPVVLLLHDWPEEATTRNAIMPADCYVIAPYLCGFGEMTFKKTNTKRAGSFGICVCNMIKLIDSLSIGTFSIVCPDWNSNIADGFAVGWPRCVKRIALTSTPSHSGGLTTPLQLRKYQYSKQKGINKQLTD